MSNRHEDPHEKFYKTPDWVLKQRAEKESERQRRIQEELRIAAYEAEMAPVRKEWAAREAKRRKIRDIRFLVCIIALFILAIVLVTYWPLQIIATCLLLYVLYKIF